MSRFEEAAESAAEGASREKHLIRVSNIANAFAVLSSGRASTSR
jgi:hypothetical protein